MRERRPFSLWPHGDAGDSFGARCNNSVRGWFVGFPTVSVPVNDEKKPFADPETEAERAINDLPDQIARARARFDSFRDALERLEARRPASADGGGS